MALVQNRKLDKYAGYLLIALLLPLARLLGILLRRDHRCSVPPHTILFIKLLGLGSLVIASGAVKTIRKRFPHTRLVLLTDDNIAEGIAPFKLFDEIWRVNTNSLVTTGITSIPVLQRCWKIKHLWVADLEVYSKLTTVFSLLTMGLNRYGFILRPVLFRRYLNTHNVLFDQSGYLEDNYYGMVQSITGLKTIPGTAVRARKNEAQKPYIVINNTCSDLAPERKLPEATLSAVCLWLLNNTPYRLALLGTGRDRPGIDRFINSNPALRHRKQYITNLAGTMDFETYYRFLTDQGALLLTIDSAPLHIAQKLGLPTLSLWGPTNPKHYFRIPENETERHVQHYLQLPCSPCIHRYEKLPCGGNNTCMKNISAESIIEKIRPMISSLRQLKLS